MLINNHLCFNVHIRLIHVFLQLLFHCVVVSCLFCFLDCVKGYYKRAKAHAAVWNEKEARRDFNMVAQLDITLASLIHRELKALSERMKEKYWEEKEQYWKKLEKNENTNEVGEAERNDDEEEKQTGEIEEGKQEHPESATTEANDKVGDGSEESPPEYAEVHEENLGENKVALTEGTVTKEEARSSAGNLNTCDQTEGKDWQQMLRLVMLLQNEGNFLIKENRFQEASGKFKEALEYVDCLQNKVSNW